MAAPKPKLPNPKDFASRPRWGKRSKIDLAPKEVQDWLKEVCELWAKGDAPGVSYRRLAEELSKHMNGGVSYKSVYHFVDSRWPHVTRALRERNYDE
jgi:hypothetical protein